MKYFIFFAVLFGIVGAFFGREVGGFIGLFLGAVVGTIVGIVMTIVNKDKKIRDEQLRKQHANEAAIREAQEQDRKARQKQIEDAARQRYQIWKDSELPKALKSFENIAVDIVILEEDSDLSDYDKPDVDMDRAISCCEQLEKLKKEAYSADDRYGDYISVYNGLYQSTIDNIKKRIHEAAKAANWNSATYIMSKLYQLSFLTDDDGYIQVADRIYQFLVGWLLPITHVNIEEYGSIFPPNESFENDEQVEKVEKKLDNKISAAFTINEMTSPKDWCFNLTSDDAWKAEKIMWYYAQKKPFNTGKFESACERYGIFTRQDSVYSLVELIARIYAKKELGGELTVKDDMKTIIEWLSSDIHQQQSLLGQKLASSLAAMELYSIEHEVLKELVRQRVQLTPMVQERLKFLSEGGTDSVKVFEISETNEFLFDNSSADWDEKKISTFFRNAKMKKIIPKYALIISRWKRTIPLTQGQSFSLQQLLESFNIMIEDYDNEVDCLCVNARAVDLENVTYPDAVLFRFHSNRNRCVNILFYCEKFGRNVNVTILTLFVPEKELSSEEMEKYALAIKNNMYVVSFRESILQEVEEALTIKNEIYEDNVQYNESIFS